MSAGVPSVANSAGAAIRSALAGLATLLVLGAGVSKAADEAADAVGRGDLLQIMVFGEVGVSSMLSGQFRVGPDGTINYPVLGSLDVAGKSPQAVGQAIHTALGDQVPISAVPTVTVSEYAPVYLLGNVQRPGPHPYLPGLTVMKLLVSTGGIPPLASPNVAATFRQDLADLEFSEYALRVRRSRLLAEIEGSHFQVSAIGPSAPGGDGVASTELAIYQAHLLAAEGIAASYRARRATYDREIASLSENIKLHGQEVALVQEDLKVQEGLSERGLVPRSRLSEVRRELVVMQRQALDLQTSLFQAEQNRLDMEQRLADAEITSRRQSLESLRDVELELNQTKLKLRYARSMLNQTAPDSEAPERALGNVVALTLIRATDDGYATFVADLATPLRRGDILRVDLTNGSQTPLEIAPDAADIASATSRQGDITSQSHSAK